MQPERNSATPTLREGRCLGADTTAAWLEGSIDGLERARIERHLDTCHACRGLVADLAADSAGWLRPAHAEPTRTERARVPLASWLTTVPERRLSDEARFASGDRVDHFRIDRLIGRGGMGEVYLADDTTLGRQVALKMVGAGLEHAPRSMERFIREARTTARLNHPNIVTIHAVGQHCGRPYLALEYVEGRTLRQWARDGGAGEPAAVLDVCIAIADALAAAHERGVLHRDLKPENVLVGADRRVRVLDFGLAVTIDDGAEGAAARPLATGVAGTPRYMAPEQWLREPTSGATDVWALGLILYELLCGGRHPWEGDGARLAEAVVHEPFAPIDPTAPAPLRRFVERCLSRAPDARPAAAEAADTLRRIREQARRRPARPSRPAWAGMVLLLATLGATAGVAGAWPRPSAGAVEVTPAATQPQPADASPVTASTTAVAAPEPTPPQAIGGAPSATTRRPPAPPRARPSREPDAPPSDDWLRRW